MASLPSSMISSSEAGAGPSASSRGVSSSEMESNIPSPTLAMTSLPSPKLSSSEASAGTYASSRGVSSSVLASSSESPIIAMTSLPSAIICSSEASGGTSASSRGVSSSEIATSSQSHTLAMTSVPTIIILSSEASAGTYASSMGVSLYGMGSNSPSPTLGMTSVERSTMSSSEASAGTYSSSRGEPASESLPSSSSTLPLYVPASSLSSGAYLLPSQSSVNQILSTHPTKSPLGSNSFTSFLPTPTSSRMSLPAAVTSSLLSTAITSLPSASALLSDIISPSSSLLSPGQPTAIPGTYKQEPTTEGTTITTTIPGVAPSISNPSQNVNAFFGENVILSCDVTGVPQPSVMWYYNTQDIYNAKPNGNNLSLAYVTNDNTGDYTCVAENSVGVANGTIHVQINKPITISVEKPIVVLEPDSVTQLLCKTKVKPPPKFTWSKYGGGLDLPTDPTIVDFGDGEMLLTGVNNKNIQQYEGIYICHADNGVSTNEAYLVVAGNTTKTLGNSYKFSDIGMQPGEAFHAMCVPGTVDAEGLSLTTTFASTDSICDSARKVSVLAKDAGPVTWFIRLDGKAEFVNETKGAVLSTDAPTARDVPMSQLSNKATAVKAPLTCETCSGPHCGMVPGPDTQCPSMTSFCMTTINTRADGRKSVTKSCVSASDCETKWWQLTSTEAKCMTPVPGNPDNEDFTCSYCCTDSGCNKDGVPKKDTLYKGNI
ncbi:hemicentin-1-like [Haliotis rufescens]|uniref:hemicentin-1-like n=1 Tax=Haliotis rufescens TaxID=6454 RepID=UPI00201F9CEE|nr:hemicentin-1-like [Haliotis rufescens]